MHQDAETAEIANLATCGHERATPRIVANMATINLNLSNTRQSMKLLLDYILKYHELKDNTIKELIL